MNNEYVTQMLDAIRNSNSVVGMDYSVDMLDPSFRRTMDVTVTLKLRYPIEEAHLTQTIQRANHFVGHEALFRV